MTIEHDQSNQRYVLTVDDSEVVLRYQRPNDNTIDFTSTFTPTNLRGQGLARKVVEHALDEADSLGLNIIGSCWYVAKILKERANT